ncbi:LLM class flavin-dependent oxidoreductase [Nocardia sp. BMG51109]|uniref:LLM class flavin-dependent oxidoreductase n=1 Tax=Nocardia sp. BMG51109 TaxID=1056816 RepID=UPI000463EC0A|nr:LLM class flavin-dependent oxidoreductase [Nocardia sp. BMG51109]
MTAPGTGPLVVPATTTEEASAILDDPALLAAWRQHPAVFAVIGIDRLGVPVPRPPAGDLDPSLLATALAAAGGPAVVVAAAAHIDLPYNLARRVLSLDHLTRGRAGVLLGDHDPRGRTPDAWSGAGLGHRAALGPETTADTARALTGLWHSWPLDSIVGDKRSGILVRSDRIRQVDHRGAAATAGPMSIPASVQGAPILGWYGTDPTGADRPTGVADLVVLGALPHPETATAALAHAPGQAPLLVEVPADAPAAAAGLLAAGAGGILLRTSDPRPPARTAERLLRTATELIGRPGRVDGHRHTLREALGLAAPADPLPTAAAAFPAPSPAAYR